MSSDAYEEAFVWIWLPGETEPVVAGRLHAVGSPQLLIFNYGKSYLERDNAIPIYLPELPLRPGELPLPDGLTMPSSIRDAAPDAWGRRVILNRKFGVKGKAIDEAELSELGFYWSPDRTASARSIFSARQPNTFRAHPRTQVWKSSSRPPSVLKKASL